MKQSHLLAMMQNDMTTIHVAFRSDLKEAVVEDPSSFATLGGSKSAKTVRTYAYKAALIDDIQPDDYVVVEGPKGGPMVALVVRVDEKANIDPDADYDYKWIVQKVDRRAYEARLQRDAAFLETMKEVEREAQKATLIENFKNHLPEGSDARAKFDAAIAQATKPLILENGAK